MIGQISFLSAMHVKVQPSKVFQTSASEFRNAVTYSPYTITAYYLTEGFHVDTDYETLSRTAVFCTVIFEIEQSDASPLKMFNEVDECSAELSVIREQVDGVVVVRVWFVFVVASFQVRQPYGRTQRSQVRAGC